MLRELDDLDLNELKHQLYLAEAVLKSPRWMQDEELIGSYTSLVGDLKTRIKEVK